MVGYLVAGEGGKEHLPVRDDHILALKSCIFFFGNFAQNVESLYPLTLILSRSEEVRLDKSSRWTMWSWNFYAFKKIWEVLEFFCIFKNLGEHENCKWGEGCDTTVNKVITLWWSFWVIAIRINNNLTSNNILCVSSKDCPHSAWHSALFQIVSMRKVAVKLLVRFANWLQLQWVWEPDYQIVDTDVRKCAQTSTLPKMWATMKDLLLAPSGALYVAIKSNNQSRCWGGWKLM